MRQKSKPSQRGSFLAYGHPVCQCHQTQWVHLLVGVERKKSTKVVMAAKLICTKWEHGELLPKLTPRNQSKLKFIYMGDVDSGDKSVITCPGGEHPTVSQSDCMLFLYPGYKKWNLGL